MMIAASQLVKSFSSTKVQYVAEIAVLLAFIGSLNLSRNKLSNDEKECEDDQEKSSPHQESTSGSAEEDQRSGTTSEDDDLLPNKQNEEGPMEQNEINFVAWRVLPHNMHRWVLPLLIYFINKGETFLPPKLQYFTKFVGHLINAYKLNRPGHEFDGPLYRDNICTAVSKVGPTVVHISLPKESGSNAKGKVGSGIIFDRDGFILTCSHGVADYLYKKVSVKLLNQQTFEGTVISNQKKAHISIVKINPYFPLPTAEFGPMRGLSPGDRLIVMGSPEPFRSNFTLCRVSSVDSKGMGNKMKYLKMDDSIRVGNSGGPILDMKGEIVGIHILEVSGDRKLSFVLPINGDSIRGFPSKWKTRQKWCGFELANLHEVDNSVIKSRHLELPDVKEGVIIAEVERGSLAHNAGFRPGDIIIKFGEKPISSAKEIIDMMRSNKTGHVEVTVKRGANALKNLTLAAPQENV